MCSEKLIGNGSRGSERPLNSDFSSWERVVRRRGVLSRKMRLAGQKGQSCGGGGCSSERIRLDYMQSDCGLMQFEPIPHAPAAIERCSEVVVAFTIPLFGQRPLDLLTRGVNAPLAWRTRLRRTSWYGADGGVRGCRCVVGRCLGWLPPSLRSRHNRFSVSPGRMCNPTILVEKPCVAEGSFGEKGERDVWSSNHALYQA